MHVLRLVGEFLMIAPQRVNARTKRPLSRSVAVSGLVLGWTVVGLLASGAVRPLGAESTAAETTASPSEPAFRVIVREAGFYGVAFDDLAAQAPELEPIATERIALFHRGTPIPVRTEDGGDGWFGPGDRLVFFGDRLAGEQSYYDEHSRENVYQLRFDRGRDEGGPDSPGESPPGGSATGGGTTPDEAGLPEVTPILRRSIHLEEEELRVRFRPGPDGSMPPVWYWKRMTHLDPEPWTVEIDLSGFAAPSAGPNISSKVEEEVALSLHLWGWSLPGREARGQVADHRIDVLWNDEILAAAEWDGQVGHRIDLVVPAHRVQDGVNRLGLSIPKRKVEEQGQPVLDVQLLDWIRVELPVRPELVADQIRWQLPSAADAFSLGLAGGEGGHPPIVLTDLGHDLEAFPGDARSAGQAAWRIEVPTGTSEIRALTGDPSRARVEVDRPSSWHEASHRADYLMITDRSLREAIEPLAEFHRSRGLAVQVVDVQDVYDEWNHGILHPEAIRQFIRWAAREWAPPQARFVLLVGDASWDPHHEVGEDSAYADWTFRPGEKRHFVKNASTGYEEVRARQRIPTWNVGTFDGYAASDNPYVDLDEDGLPDLAIGRFPVVKPEEVEAIVEKSVRHARRVEAGEATARRSLWITNEARGFQSTSDQLVAMVEGRGFEAEKVYPSREEADNALHQKRLVEAFDSGQTLVHFLGHGGRYIWRTGPPDLKKNHDLFTLEHLDQLAPAEDLPVVLSMTCYSAPFDHPTADSIGEKLLRLEDRGAVAVFAASWRNSPSAGLSKSLVRELTRPGTIGEAILQAKREVRSPLLIETYNLLGDPALPVVSGDIDPQDGGEAATAR